MTGSARVLSSDHPLPWLFPLIAILVLFTIYPLFYNVYLSFHEYSVFKRDRFAVHEFHAR
jgi:multiple sugar transport system permease protein